MRWSVLIVLLPLLVLIVWAAVYDLRRRRRRAQVDVQVADASIRAAKSRATGWQ